MKKLIIISALLVAGIAFAEFVDVSVYKNKSDLQRLSKDVAANFTAVEDGTGAGATALSVTNGQAVTVSAGVYILSGIGGANDSTNTITLVAPTAAGQKVTLLMATASTNLVTIADGTTVAASGVILMDFNDNAVLQAVDTSTWLLVSESDN
ncbi:MAG: hypothetical protein GY833_23985 [Aestuariibacter sp.]|nr:hypothetical protein [Aestuariibacter sp.]